MMMVQHWQRGLDALARLHRLTSGGKAELANVGFEGKAFDNRIKMRREAVGRALNHRGQSLAVNEGNGSEKDILAYDSSDGICSHHERPRTSHQSPLHSMVDTERAFAKASEEKGTSESFLMFIADDGILFRPTAVLGKKWLQENPLTAL